MSDRVPIVYIVDDDQVTRSYFDAVLSSANVRCCRAESAAAFLEMHDPDQPGCLLLDVQMPGMTGPELQHELNLRGAIIPVIFISSHAGVPTAVEAMLHGAFDFLQKPVSHETLLARVRNALDYDAGNRAALHQRDQVTKRFDALTSRERDVLALLIAGHPNKVMASELGLSERTVEVYRARVMKKTAACSLAHLVRMAMEVQSASSSAQPTAAIRANRQPGPRS
jgi:two-component system, LuxR family, response regulator FixJ